MDIYTILSSKSHNSHYLKRYITFIYQCQQQNLGYGGYTEKHHICPKAKDMFPDYKSFRDHPWNRVALTPRQHFIAHIILWKVFPQTSQTDALWAMKNKNSSTVNSRIYETLRIDIRNKNSLRMQKLTANGEHPWQGDKNPSRKRIKEGTHIFQSENHPAKIMSREGTHPWFGPETNAKYAKDNAKKRVENGSYSRIAKEQNMKRVENGTHHFLGPEHNKKRIENGTHNFIGKIPCVDKKGVRIQIEKDVFYSQTGDEKMWEYVHFNSKEGYERRGLSQSARNKACKGKVSVIDKSGKCSFISQDYYKSQEGRKEAWEYVSVNSKEAKNRK
jgi:hypothetical protein